MSIEELARITPVIPPTVNIEMNPSAQIMGASILLFAVAIVASHLNTLIPVGTAIVIVAAVK